MTNEELEKTMQFILEQQAQFAVNQQRSDERVSRFQTDTNERLSRLETNMTEMARTQAHMNEVVAVMLETHRHTEEKLDAFISVLERYISADRNGKGNGDSAAR